MRRDSLLIIDVAMNGIKRSHRNPNVPQMPEEIMVEAEGLIKAGATMLHAHNRDIELVGEAAAEDYLRAWKPIFDRHPNLIWYPTITDLSGRPAGDLTHVEILAREAGVQIGAVDPAPVNLGGWREDGSPKAAFVYNNNANDVAAAFNFLRERNLGAEIGIYEPGALRSTLAFHSNGLLPQGSMINLYFCGPGGMIDSDNAMLYGLPPTNKALDAYLEMLEDVEDVPWKLSVWGADIMRTPLAKRAIVEGGHIQIGLENYSQPDRKVSNVDLLKEVLELASAHDREVATPDQAREILGLRAH